MSKQTAEAPTTFSTELRALINRHGRERESNTPDFLLAMYLERCLKTYEETVTFREQWFGRAF